MGRASLPPAFDAAEWPLARAGDVKEALARARKALAELPARAPAARHVDLLLVAAFCLIRQGQFSEALHELEVAANAAGDDRGLMRRIAAWQAEVAYYQGRYSAAVEVIESVAPALEAAGDFAYAAFAMRVRIFVLLARADYDAIEANSAHAVALAEAANDDYILVQVLNALGAAHFDRATSKLPQPHARSHITSLDPGDVGPMQEDAKAALALFERARDAAERAGLQFAAWFVAGNIERLEILLGHAERAVAATRKRLEVMQAHGAKYDEIVVRSNLAWGLRVLGRYPEALHELDVALELARATGTFNMMLEFLHYDRSIVLGALGELAAARASYRRYLRSGAWARAAPPAQGTSPTAVKRPLEPFFLKRADRFILDHIGTPFAVEELARYCGVSWRTLQAAFAKFRGVTAVAHIRNLRLDGAHEALARGEGTVKEIAARFAFRSVTTFANEYRRRFGMPPSRRLRTTDAG